MMIDPLTILEIVGALVAGVLIGLAFGQLQQIAWRRHTALEGQGRFNSGWAVMPGSFRRVGFLMLALVLVQLGYPFIFTQGAQWWVSGGVLAGYGFLLWRGLRRRLGLLHTNHRAITRKARV